MYEINLVNYIFFGSCSTSRIFGSDIQYMHFCFEYLGVELEHLWVNMWSTT